MLVWFVLNTQMKIMIINQVHKEDTFRKIFITLSCWQEDDFKVHLQWRAKNKSSGGSGVKIRLEV